MLPLIINEYKKNEMDLDIKDINGHTPLFVAAIKGFYQIFYVLMKNGANM